jgi:GNAT superfamily N-acetyltransferase
MPLEISKATPEDVAAIAPLFDSYRMFYKQTSDITAAINFLMERIEKNQSVIFVAEESNEVVGFCQLFPIFTSVGLQRTWLLNDLFVTENARGKGVATALLKRAEAFGKETLSKWLLLQTTADNKTAHSIYEKNGWLKLSDYFYELPLQ